MSEREDEPISHIRRPNPPWRDDALTECGKPEAEFASVISCDEAIALVKQHGKQRAAFLLCMTCMRTAQRHSYAGASRAEPQDWLRDPVAVMHRYLDRVRWNAGAEAATIRVELQAIGALVAAHREEFDSYVAGVAATGDIATRRAARRYLKETS